MAISPDFIKELKSRVDIVDIIGGYVDLKYNGGIYKGCCPFHEDDTPSLTVYPETQSYYCFGCGAGSKDENGSSDIIAFVMAINKDMEFGDAIKFLAGYAGMEIPKGKTSPEITKAIKLREKIVQDNRRYYRTLAGSKQVLEYLRKRNIGQAEQDKYRIGLVPAGENFGDRIAICIFNEKGDPVGFAYRKRQGAEGEKYLNDSESIIFKKGKILYGLNFVRPQIRELGYVVVVEGYFDVIALQSQGVPAVGLMNALMSESQVQLLKKHTKNVVLFLDDDEGGRRATLKNIKRLRDANFVVKVVRPTRGADPAEMVQAGVDIPEYIEKNQCLAGQYMLNEVLNKYQSESTELKLRTLDKVKEVIDELSYPEKALYHAQIMSALGLNYRQVVNVLEGVSDED